MLVNGEPLDALASVMHRSLVERRGRTWVKKLKPMVERQYFEVVIQAAVGRRVVARETVQPFRKDVTAKLYGGDHTRCHSLSTRLTCSEKRNYWKSKKFSIVVHLADNRPDEKECGESELSISLRKRLWSFYPKDQHDRQKKDNESV